MSKSSQENHELSEILDASLSEHEKEMVKTSSAIKEDFQTYLVKEEKTRGHLYFLGNLLLGVFTLGIAHAIFYLACFIEYGSQIQKWESKDPITWFFNRINAKVEIKALETDEKEDSSIEEVKSVSASG